MQITPDAPLLCQSRCACHARRHATKFVVVTGGPGAGKTAVLEFARRLFCEHVAVLPESASIIYGGGFPRSLADPDRRATQRAIYHVQVELENLIHARKNLAVVLCDRGTLDGLAYWPDGHDAFWRMVKTSRRRELARYDAVIHLRTPPPARYNHDDNPLRTESASQAAAIDRHLERIWRSHPHRFLVGHTVNFMDKVRHGLTLIGGLIPGCCRPVDEADLFALPRPDDR